jgi:UDP-glucose 4-epimerase
MILVTGGAGFIGSHLVAVFLERGFKFRVLDNLITGTLENLEAAAQAILPPDIRERKDRPGGGSG